MSNMIMHYVYTIWYCLKHKQFSFDMCIYNNILSVFFRSPRYQISQKSSTVLDYQKFLGTWLGRKWILSSIPRRWHMWHQPNGNLSCSPITIFIFWHLAPFLPSIYHLQYLFYLKIKSYTSILYETHLWTLSYTFIRPSQNVSNYSFLEMWL